MVVLKYNESYKGKNKKFSTAFYILAACCVLIIGGASWFALSNMSDNDTSVPQNSRDNVYSEDQAPYNDITPDFSEPTPSAPQITESVAQSTKNEPYDSSETADSFMKPVEGEVIKDFSNTVLQFSKTFGDMRIHTGIDIKSEEGTPVSACCDATVKSVEQSGNYGNIVTLKVNDSIEIKYSSLNDVKHKAGDKVKMGDTIGTVGTVPSECNDDSHLHLEVLKDNELVSPLKILGLE